MKIKLTLMCLLITNIIMAQKEKYLDISSCPFKLDSSIQITNSNEEYSHPRVSPDGSKVMVNKKAYKGVYLIDLSKSNQIITITDEDKVGFDAKWSKDGKEIKYKKNTKQSNGRIIREPFKYNLQQKSISTDKGSQLKSFEKSQEILVSFNLKRSIVEATDGLKIWDITNSPGVYFNFVVSPDQTKVLIHKNDGKMYIYAIDGSGLKCCLGQGLCQSWSPDEKYITYFIDYDNGETTIDSDIYICSTDGTKKWKLTDTPDKIELWPYWSPKGDKIVFYEARSRNIFYSNISKK